MLAVAHMLPFFKGESSSTPDFRSLVLKILQICTHARYLPFDPKSKDGEIAKNFAPDLPHIVHKLLACYEL